MPRLLLVLLLMTATLPLSGLAQNSPNAEDAKLTALVKDYLEAEFRQRPLLATQLGDHRYDDQLDDVSPTSRAEWAKRTRQTLADLPKKIDTKKLSRDGQIDFEIWQHALRRDLWLL